MEICLPPLPGRFIPWPRKPNRSRMYSLGLVFFTYSQSSFFYAIFSSVPDRIARMELTTIMISRYLVIYRLSFLF